ncbi:MAG: alpha/beta hydrolase [Chloroflexota bacterium]
MEKNITVRGKQLACTLEGNSSNPAILFIHDCASYRGVWQQTISILKAKYFCIAVDLLGFGASDKPEEGDYSLPTQGQRVLMIADQLGLGNFSLVGHAMGGQIALYIASVLAPQRIEKLVCINTIITGKFSEKAEKTFIQAAKIGRRFPWLYNLGRSFVNFKPLSNFAFGNLFFDINAIPFETWKADRLATYNPACAISTDESFKAMKAMDLIPHLRKIKARTLIIAGKQDKITPLDQALLAQTLIPNNDLALIEKCGHYPMIEKSGNFNKAMGLIY